MGREGFLPRSFKLEFKQKTSLYIQAFNSPKSPQPIQIPDPDPRWLRNAECMLLNIPPLVHDLEYWLRYIPILVVLKTLLLSPILLENALFRDN